MQALMWLTTLTAIAGNVLVIQKNRWGYALWIASNVVLVWRNLAIGEHAQASLFIVYLALACWGFAKWSVEE